MTVMKNHTSDFDSPFGKFVVMGSGVLASCKFCPWTRETKDNPRKHWSAASRARMSLQLHALSQHKIETHEYDRKPSVDSVKVLTAALIIVIAVWIDRTPFITFDLFGFFHHPLSILGHYANYSALLSAGFSKAFRP